MLILWVYMPKTYVNNFFSSKALLSDYLTNPCKLLPPPMRHETAMPDSCLLRSGTHRQWHGNARICHAFRNSTPPPPMRRYCKLRAASYNAMKPPCLTIARHVQEHTAKGTETPVFATLSGTPRHRHRCAVTANAVQRPTTP